MERKLECKHYSSCLDKAARSVPSRFDCAGCTAYEEQPLARVDEFEEELTGRKGIIDTTKEEGEMGTCKVTNCDKVVIARGLCHSHYDQWRKGEIEMVSLMGGEFVAVRKVKARGPKAEIGSRKSEVRSQRSEVRGQKSEGRGRLPAATRAAQAGTMEKTTETMLRLVDAHWAYIEELLKAHGQDVNVKIIEYHYRTAFVHGFKHGVEMVAGAEIAV